IFAACLSLPISSAQRERSLSSSTSFLSISSMRRRQSPRFMADSPAIRDRPRSRVSGSRRNLPAGKAVAGRVLQGANLSTEGRSGSLDRARPGARLCGVFDLGNQRGADDRGIGKAAKNGNVARERNPEAHGEREFGDRPGAAQQCGKVVGKGVLCSGDAGAGNEIQETRGTGRDFREPLVGGGRSAEKNRVEAMRTNNPPVILRFFGREIGHENTVGAGRSSSRCEFLNSHLQNGIEVAEQHQGEVRSL